MTKFTLLAALVFSSIFSFSQDVDTLWIEDFGTSGCNQGALLSSYSSTNGSWVVDAIGTNEFTANQFFVSGTANGTGEGNCSNACGANANPSLHIGPQANILTAADAGPLYLESDPFTCDFFGICAITNKRASSPVINTTGETELTLSFLYIEGGNGSDNAQLWINYEPGLEGWQVLQDLPKTASCGSDGIWTAYSIDLPALALDNPNLRIGFSWRNNDDAIASDPSFAVDDILITKPVSTDCLYDFNEDGFINTADLIILLGVFGQFGDELTDVTGDGVTNTSELVGLLGVFGSACP